MSKSKKILPGFKNVQVEKDGKARVVIDDDEMSKFMKTIISAFATFERAQIASRTKQTLRMKKAAGFRVSRWAPVGYDFSEDEKRVVENKDEQQVLQLIKTLKDDGKGITAIKRELEERGIKTKRGNDTWHYQTMRNLYHRVS